VGVALSLVVLYVLSTDLTADPNTARFILSPARPALFNYYITGWLDLPLATFGSTTRLRHVGLTLLAGAGEVALAAVGLWAWLRWRENRI
jgi:hypothetical protein